MCTVLLPPGGYPTTVNRYIIYPIINKFRRQNSIIDVIVNLHYSFVVIKCKGLL